MKRALAIAAIAILFQIGCNKTGGTAAASANYPSGWPLSYIKVPAGATQVPASKITDYTGVPASGTQTTGFGYGITGTTYSVFFDSSAQPNELQQALESQLRASGDKWLVQRIDQKNHHYGYIQADGTEGVSLGPATWRVKTWQLYLRKYDSPMVINPSWTPLL